MKNDDYLILLQQLLEQQYGSLDNIPEAEDNCWIPAESNIKERMFQANPTRGSIDLSSAKKDKIKNVILSGGEAIKIGNFLIKIKKEFSFKHLFTIDIYEIKGKTPSGIPSQDLTCRVNMDKDSRFIGRPWIKYFSFSSGKMIPLETVLDIIRWTQAINKLACFV